MCHGVNNWDRDSSRWALGSRAAHRRHRSESSAGIAIMEFIISLPFLMLVTTAMVDIAFVMNHYLAMLNAVHAGVRIAESMPDLEPGGARGLSGGQNGCASIVGTGTFHAFVQQRVVELVTENSPRLDANSVCVESFSYTRPSDAGQTYENTVKIRVTANYQRLFPPINNIPITVESSGPALR